MKNGRLSQTVTYTVVFIIFLAFALSYLFIFFWGITAGLKTHNEIVLSPFALPESWQIKNYIEVFTLLNVEGTGFFGMLLNSVYFSVLGQFICCMTTCMLAYVTCKYKFPGSRFIFVLVTFVLILPIYGNGGSMYSLLYRLGMVNSYSHILIMFGGVNIYYLYFHAAFSSLSWTYAEAAFIDGANDFTVFFKVMLPQVMPVFGALFLMMWISDWNNYASALIYLNKMPTLASGIYQFDLTMTRYGNLHILYAAYMISAIPPIVLFTLFNKTLTSNVSIGGIKE